MREVKIKRRAKDVKNVEVFWQNFLDKHELDMLMPDVWMFGDGSSEMGNRLGQLVVSGRKTATCSSLDIYKMEEEQLLKLVNTT